MLADIQNVLTPGTTGTARHFPVTARCRFTASTVKVGVSTTAMLFASLILNIFRCAHKRCPCDEIQSVPSTNLTDRIIAGDKLGRDVM
jgi:hypothetical protein